MKPRIARLDASLRATILWRKPLHYRDGADEALDRPAHVRAGSGLAWIDGRLAMIQDDANFIALVDPATGLSDSIALPAGKDGLRQFDEGRGNKKFKLDLEACCALPGKSGTRLLALGSGSKDRRRMAVVVDRLNTARPRTSLVDASALYLSLEDAHEFAGSDMNIEGALALPDAVRLFGRANGRVRDGRVPVNATCDLAIAELFAYLGDWETSAPPSPRAIVQYDLGGLDSLSLGFTDATLIDGTVLYTAAAEASKDSTEDGLVSGSVIGIIPESGPLRYTPLVERDGERCRDKVEGIAVAPGTPGHVYVVVDRDDAARPTELCEVRLEGL